MNLSSGAPARLSELDIPEQLDITRVADTAPKSGTDPIVGYLRLLWQQRRFLSRVMLYGLLGSALIAFLIPARYESTARLMPPDSNQTGGLAATAAALSSAAGGLGGSFASEMLGLKSTSEIFVGILSSRTVQDHLIQQFDLQKHYGDRRMEDARKDLAKHTDLGIDRKSQIITITVTDHDPKRAASMGEAYVEQLNRLVADLSTSSARRERMFLEQRLQAVSEDLESAEKEFSQYSSKNSAIDIKEQGRAMVEAAAVLQGQLIAAESELAGLKQIYTDNNARIRSVRAQVDALKRELEKIGGKDDSAAEPSGMQKNSLYPSIRQLPLLGVTYADLYRRTRVQEAVFESLTKEYELAKVQEVKEIPTVKVLDPPDIPDKKSFPPRLLIMFLGSAFMFAAATSWVLAKTTWERSDSADPRKALAEEVFATVKASLPRFAQNGSGNYFEKGDSASPISRRRDEG